MLWSDGCIWANKILCALSWAAWHWGLHFACGWGAILLSDPFDILEPWGEVCELVNVNRCTWRGWNEVSRKKGSAWAAKCQKCSKPPMCKLKWPQGGLILYGRNWCNLETEQQLALAAAVPLGQAGLCSAQGAPACFTADLGDMSQYYPLLVSLSWPSWAVLSAELALGNQPANPHAQVDLNVLASWGACDIFLLGCCGGVLGAELESLFCMGFGAEETWSSCKMFLIPALNTAVASDLTGFLAPGAHPEVLKSLC